MVGKIDESEALGIAKKELFKRSLIGALIISILAAIAGYIIGNFITKPIKSITHIRSYNDILKNR